MPVKIQLQLPADAAARLVTLLNAPTPEGDAARKALGVTSCKLVPARGETL